MTTESASSLASDILRRSQPVVLRVGLTIQLFIVSAIFYYIRPSSDAVILRFNVFFGVDLLGVWWQVYLIPSMCMVLFLGNLILAEILARRRVFLAALVLVHGSILILIAEVVAIAALIRINT